MAHSSLPLDYCLTPLKTWENVHISCDANALNVSIGNPISLCPVSTTKPLPLKYPSCAPALYMCNIDASSNANANSNADASIPMSVFTNDRYQRRSLKKVAILNGFKTFLSEVGRIKAEK